MNFDLIKETQQLMTINIDNGSFPEATIYLFIYYYYYYRPKWFITSGQQPLV